MRAPGTLQSESWFESYFHLLIGSFRPEAVAIPTNFWVFTFPSAARPRSDGDEEQSRAAKKRSSFRHLKRNRFSSGHAAVHLRNCSYPNRAIMTPATMRNSTRTNRLPL